MLSETGTRPLSTIINPPASSSSYSAIGGLARQTPLEPRNSVAPSSPGQRECRLQRKPDFNGFGFKVQYDEESDLKHRVSHVAPNSPAEQQGKLDRRNLLLVFISYFYF